MYLLIGSSARRRRSCPREWCRSKAWSRHPTGTKDPAMNQQNHGLRALEGKTPMATFHPGPCDGIDLGCSTVSGPAYARQRSPDRRGVAWEAVRNKHHAKVEWQFTTAGASVKLKTPRPSI